MAVATESYADSFNTWGQSKGREAKAKRVWSMYLAARRHEAYNRVLQNRDEDAYHNDQWDHEVKAEMEDEGRPALTINLLKPTVDLILGDNIVNRDMCVAVPVGQSDEEGANAYTQVYKYLMDECEGESEWDEAYADAVISGLGVVEVDVRRREDLRYDTANGFEYEPYVRHERREYVWVDPLCRRKDWADARFVCRAMWLDVDEACAMFSKHKKKLRELAMNRQDHDGWWNDVLEDNTAEPDAWESVLDWQDDPADFISEGRNQVLIIECQYREIETVQMAVMPDGDMEEFDRRNQQHVDLLNATSDEDLDLVFPELERKRVRIAHTCGPILLDDDLMPHKHGEFTLIPVYAYRDRKGRPYGIIRQLYDSQMDYNKRRSTALFLMAAKRILVEANAVKSLAYLAKMGNNPNAVIEFAEGALRDNRVRFERDADLAPAHVETMGIAKQEIEQTSGVNQEMRGQGPGDQSGRAIMARQAQGNLMLAPLRQNFKLARKKGAYMMASLASQYMTAPKELKITEAPTNQQWVTINAPGGVSIKDIKVNWTIEEAPATASVRQQNLQLLQDFMVQMPPEVRMGLIPELIDAYDIPNKERIKAASEQILGAMGFIGATPPPGMMAAAMGIAPGGAMPQTGMSGGPIAQQPAPAAMPATA